MAAIFAYGTLMTAEGFRECLGERAAALRFRPARLEGWRRIWNARREAWGGGILNIERHPDAHVWGVLVEGLAEEDLARLDAQEASHLPRERVYVELADGSPAAAEMYWQRRGDWTGPASARYQAVVLQRAAQAGPEVLESLRVGSVDAAGELRRLG